MESPPSPKRKESLFKAMTAALTGKMLAVNCDTNKRMTNINVLSFFMNPPR